jgi:hypothetical protein
MMIKRKHLQDSAKGYQRIFFISSQVGSIHTSNLELLGSNLNQEIEIKHLEVSSSCEYGNEPSGSIKFWETIK